MVDVDGSPQWAKGWIQYFGRQHPLGHRNLGSDGGFRFGYSHITNLECWPRKRGTIKLIARPRHKDVIYMKVQIDHLVVVNVLERLQHAPTYATYDPWAGIVAINNFAYRYSAVFGHDAEHAIEVEGILHEGDLVVTKGKQAIQLASRGS